MRDESDRDGMRVVVEVKRGSSPEVRPLPKIIVPHACMHAGCRQYTGLLRHRR